MPRSGNPAASPSESLVLESQFGVVPYRPEEVLTFAEGLFGYEKRKAFLLHRHPLYLPFMWLIDVADANLMFPIIQAADLSSDYHPEIPDAGPQEACYVIVAIGDETEGVTANLRAPLLISTAEKRGRQVILTDSNYPLRFHLVQQKKAGE